MPYLQMSGIVKRFKDVAANDHVDFSLEKGEIHALLGENGAGKSTLMHILYGMIQPDEGTIRLNDQIVRFASPIDAINQGISMVHQHFMLVENMTVAENIVLGFEPRINGRFDKPGAVASVRELSERYGLAIDPHAKVENLPVGAKQRIEILKALYRKADLLILDEPTAVLTRGEVDDFFKVLKNLRKDGKTIIIITHKLGEVMDIADRVSVLRGGKFVASCGTENVDANRLAEMMIGRSVLFDVSRNDKVVAGEIVLKMQNVTCVKDKVKRLDGLDLELRAGEILGIAGVEGNGQTELAEVLAGLQTPNEGEIIINGKTITRATSRMMTNLKVGHIPEDRERNGLIKSFTIAENLILGYQHFRKFGKHGIMDLKAISANADVNAEEFAIKTPNTRVAVSTLSGGNQQKVVVARVLSMDPNIIVAAQPTRGVDIGAIEYIHQKLIEMKEAGKGVLLISAELDEIMKLSDRICVIYEGRIVANDLPEKFDEYRLGMLMTGLKSSQAVQE